MPPLHADTVAAFRPLDEHLPADWTAATTTALDGATLRWLDTGGDGPPVVLLHGIQVDGRSWLRTARHLAPRHRVLLPDLRGHGRSARVDATLTPDVHVADVRAVLDAARVETPIVVGHSLGAEIAGFLAATMPTRGVVLVDPVLRPMPMPAFDVDAPPPWFAPILATLRELRDLPHAERMVAGLRLLPPGLEVDWAEEDYVTFVEGQASFDIGVYAHLDPDAPTLARSPQVVAAITAPILLLTAAPMMPGAGAVDATPLSDHWRSGSHVHLADSGHMIPADRFDRFTDLVDGFIAALPDAAGR